MPSIVVAYNRKPIQCVFRVRPLLVFPSLWCPYVKVFVLLKTARRQKEKNSWIQGTHQLAAPLAVSSPQTSDFPSPV